MHKLIYSKDNGNDKMKNENGNEISKQGMKKENGSLMEKKAYQILTKKFENVQFVDGLIDYYANNNIPIEIKSCQYLIESGNPKYPKRYGRFKLEIDQHKFLEKHNGYYLFLVQHFGFIVSGKLLSVNDVSFAKQVGWRELVNRPNFDVSDLEVLHGV